jgi:hypothetical protein
VIPFFDIKIANKNFSGQTPQEISSILEMKKLGDRESQNRNLGGATPFTRSSPDAFSYAGGVERSAEAQPDLESSGRGRPREEVAGRSPFSGAAGVLLGDFFFSFERMEWRGAACSSIK